MLTSCTLPLVMLMNVGMLPCRSSSVCILTAALCFRNLAQGNNERHRSMVVESPRVQTLLQLHADRIRCIERSREANQNLREVGVDPPVMRVVGVGQRGACHPAVKTHMVEFAAQ